MLRQSIFSLATVSICTVVAGFAETWPPKLERNTPMPTNPPPYLVDRPAVIPIDVGRQLFVDDYLLDETKGLTRVYNHPVKMFDGPVLWPETPLELEEDVARPHRFAPVCAATSGGLWWDPVKKVFRLWYEAGWMKNLCYAESKDGVTWTRPDCGIVKGTNRVLTDALLDSWNVFPDYASDRPYENWRLMVSVAGGTTDNRLYSSTDGTHWNFLGLAGQSGDRTTFFYNPFRGKWVYSLRGGGPGGGGRNRSYWESRDFGGPEARWNFSGKKAPPEYQGLPAPHPWLATDALDLPDPAVAGRTPQLYNVDAVAYESLMVGMFEILHPGPKDNGSSVEAGMPKITDLHFAYSRDGWHFTRPDRTAAIASSRWGTGKWDSGYLSPMGGICVIQNERLWFYYTGMRGDATETTPYQKDPEVGWRQNGMHFNASIGVASLRRDGFVGLVADGRGEAVTHPVRFSGSHLFVNAECRFGSLTVAVLDESGKVLPGFSAEDCVPVRRTDSTKVEVTWNGTSLEKLSGRSVQFRFKLHCGTLYAFWVAPSSRGESCGYLAAGGPAYPGLRDL